jgi:hypothetical protein
MGSTNAIVDRPNLVPNFCVFGLSPFESKPLPVWRSGIKAFAFGLLASLATGVLAAATELF